MSLLYFNHIVFIDLCLLIPASSANNNRSVFQVNCSLQSSISDLPFESFCFHQQGSCNSSNCLVKYYPPSPSSLLSAPLLVLFLLICALEVILQREVHQKTLAWTLFFPPASTSSLWIPASWMNTYPTPSRCKVYSPLPPSRLSPLPSFPPLSLLSYHSTYFNAVTEHGIPSGEWHRMTPTNNLLISILLPICSILTRITKANEK